MPRCPWANSDLYAEYHDHEWGVPLHDDRQLFDFLILEGAQAGLSWITILKNRANYRAAFAGFDPKKVARFGAREIERLMGDAGIVRNLLAALLRELPQRMDAAFEFRHALWFADEVLACLREHRAALCIAESEKLATPALATAHFGYLRLRQEDYTDTKIASWADFVRAQTGWRETFVYFKHEETGVGPRFAQRFRELTDA